MSSLMLPTGAEAGSTAGDAAVWPQQAAEGQGIHADDTAVTEQDPALDQVGQQLQQQQPAHADVSTALISSSSGAAQAEQQPQQQQLAVAGPSKVLPSTAEQQSNQQAGSRAAHAVQAGSGTAKRKASLQTQRPQQKRALTNLDKHITPAVRFSMDAELSD